MASTLMDRLSRPNRGSQLAPRKPSRPRAPKLSPEQKAANKTRRAGELTSRRNARTVKRVTKYRLKMNDQLAKHGLDHNNLAHNKQYFEGTRRGRQMAATMGRKARVTFSREI